jgi:hypothetical protein
MIALKTPPRMPPTMPPISADLFLPPEWVLAALADDERVVVITWPLTVVVTTVDPPAALVCWPGETVTTVAAWNMSLVPGVLEAEGIVACSL